MYILIKLYFYIYLITLSLFIQPFFIFISILLLVWLNFWRLSKYLNLKQLNCIISFYFLTVKLKVLLLSSMNQHKKMPTSSVNYLKLFLGSTKFSSNFIVFFLGLKHSGNLVLTITHIPYTIKIYFYSGGILW